MFDEYDRHITATCYTLTAADQRLPYTPYPGYYIVDCSTLTRTYREVDYVPTRRPFISLQ